MSPWCTVRPEATCAASVTGAVPASVPSLVQSAPDRAVVLAAKAILSPKGVRKNGSEPVVPGTRSSSRVPARVPSVTQSSLPEAGRLARKKTLPPATGRYRPWGFTSA